MIFKYGPIEFIFSLSIISAELVSIEIELKIHKVQILAIILMASLICVFAVFVIFFLTF